MFSSRTSNDRSKAAQETVALLEELPSGIGGSLRIEPRTTVYESGVWSGFDEPESTHQDHRSIRARWFNLPGSSHKGASSLIGHPKSQARRDASLRLPE